jgi:ribosomal protein L37AE/L43A
MDKEGGMSNAKNFPNDVIDMAERKRIREIAEGHLNGGIVAPVNPDDEKKVYGCGVCQDQGHRLMEENEIICGKCTALSHFLHYEPHKKVADHAKRLPRLRTSMVDKLANYVCRRCSHNRFHLHQSGTITCYRCRHATAWKWWLPTDESLAG